MPPDESAEQVHAPEWRPAVSWAPVEQGKVSDTRDIAAIYQAQQATFPVAWCDPGHGRGYWTLFRHEDVARVLRDPKRFSSAVPKYGEPLIPIELDPPEHTQYRALLARLINPAKMKVLEQDIRAYVRGLLDEALADPEPNLLAVTKIIPLRSFCLLVGTSNEEEWKKIKVMADDLHGRGIPLFSTDPKAIEQRRAASAPQVDYCRHQIATRRSEPGDDLVSDILAGAVHGRPVTDEEALRILTLIYIAGHRTTAASMAGILVELIKRPEIVEALKEDPSKIPAAIEELLRIESALHIMPRYCLEDTVIGGQLIRKGEQVYPVFATANVDPEGFEDPDRVDIDRRPNHHMSFGRGIHTCAGAPLARLQLRIFIEELLAQVESMDLTGTVTRDKWPRFGPTAVPVRVRLKD